MSRLVTLCFAFLAGCGGRQATLDTPRANAIALLEVGITEARPEVIRPMLGDTYRQHNPRVADGPEGLLGFVTSLAEVPRDRRVRIENVRSFEDGEFVVLHSTFWRGTRRIAGFDVLRVQDGRFVEHWDAGMGEHELNASGRGLLDGAMTEPETLQADSDATRRLITALVEALVARDGTLPGVAEDVHQHDPRFGDGRRAWLNSLEGQDALIHEELVRTFAQGEWALTQSRGRKGDVGVVVYDLFHQSGGVVVEHWVVWDVIPARMRHNNGML